MYLYAITMVLYTEWVPFKKDVHIPVQWYAGFGYL